MTALRRPGVVSAIILVGLGASLVFAHTVAPDWSRRAGLDVWNLASLKEHYRAVAEEREETWARGERSAARRAAANQIAAKLTTNTITLPEAADELAEVFSEDTGMQIVLESVHQGPTVRHVWARHAIDRVKAILIHDPAKRDAVVARLEVEYRAMCAAPELARTP